MWEAQMDASIWNSTIKEVKHVMVIASASCLFQEQNEPFLSLIEKRNPYHFAEMRNSNSWNILKCNLNLTNDLNSDLQALFRDLITSCLNFNTKGETPI